MKKDRVVYFDYLRVFATLAVMVLHVASQNWSGLDPAGYEWNVFNLYDSVVRWGVPIFIMISGALFLSREIDTKVLYSKHILRMAVSYGVWSVFYAAVSAAIKQVVYGQDISLKSVASAIIGGHFHLWFIPMIIGLYMCTPIIKKIVSTEKTADYFLLLSFIFTFVIPQISVMCNDFIGGHAALIMKGISGLVSDMNMNLVLGFAFYFVLGYRLNSIELTKKQRGIIYALGAAGFIATIVLTAVASRMAEAPDTTYYGNFRLNVMLAAVAVHTWFKYRRHDNPSVNNVVAQLSKYSFGAYLVHVFVIDVLNLIGLNTLSFQPLLSVPVIAAIVFVVSFAISFVISKIPFINKWVV
jgi:surface polysaccharide O-acyltransferase-like enzyme